MFLVFLVIYQNKTSNMTNADFLIDFLVVLAEHAKLGKCFKLIGIIKIQTIKTV